MRRTNFQAGGGFVSLTRRTGRLMHEGKKKTWLWIHRKTQFERTQAKFDRRAFARNRPECGCAANVHGVEPFMLPPPTLTRHANRHVTLTLSLLCKICLPHPARPKPIARWFNVRIQLVGATVAVLAGAFVVWWGKDHIEATVAGLVLLYALQFTDAVKYLVRQHALLEMQMNSVGWREGRRARRRAFSVVPRAWVLGASHAMQCFIFHRLGRVWQQTAPPEKQQHQPLPSFPHFPRLVSRRMRAAAPVRSKPQVERILEYTKDVPQEAAAVVQGHRPVPKWPADGALTVKNLTVQ